ncbi:SEC-C metal-binding domain-containing protein [Paenibacillus sp. F6_3S_P_1C]|uniref:SEC-C metal-binding domain-containing protein n=1 Tax=Paenibacillus vandeheii TaxID=3035917 RepID=A0ABT8J8W3_9BACL|nr:SEC-C metal-binding domain-containing protein [Paenibacillus vandeheii]MDN4600674.1 SEC-C metal-binding domain-containing protein [Paenibacillus vandeheii]
MWKKAMRVSSSISYRKRFKCPVCDSFSLYIIHDSACECENGCDETLINIGSIFEKDEFNGYFTSDYIDKHFWIDDAEINKMFTAIVDDNRYNLLNEKEKQTLKTILYSRTIKIEESLDDLVVRHLNDNGLTTVPQEMTAFGYLINLLEDTHFFMNLCCKDLALFNCGILFADKQFYSGRFFYNNAIEHLFQANERIYVILGIVYNFNFNDELSLNKNYKIEDYLKGIDDYKESDIKNILDGLKGNHMYRTLNTIRKLNTHDLSYYSKKIEEEMNKDAIAASKFWNRDGDEVDADFYLPQIKNLIFCLNKHYDLFELIISKVSSLTNIEEQTSHPMITKFMKLQVTHFDKQYSGREIQQLEFDKIKIFDKLPQYNNILIGDVFFRLNEVVRCVFDFCNMENEIFYKEWIQRENLHLYDLMDQQYLLYSAVSRIYSCYDKLSRYVSERYPQYKDIKYFHDFKKKTDKSALSNIIVDILNDDYYQGLYDLRNDIYHNLRAGTLQGEEGLVNFNYTLFIIVVENTKKIMKLIDDLYKFRNQKIGRNEPCLCGSGLKSKKCCG